MKADRGPFGSAPAERFREGRKDDSTSDNEGSVFREAPTQSGATNQLRLTEYSQKYPGRLAARMLLQMHRKSALSSVGAKLGKNRTPAAAVHYYQTMMTPSLGAKLNIRTARELRTTCTVLDLLARHRPAHAADILSQRVKALERSCREGHWGSAQFLELIPGDQDSLLERAEEYFLKKETILDQKLHSQERMNTKGPKGESKGAKGRGGKNDREKGGKGKDKQDTAAK